MVTSVTLHSTAVQETSPALLPQYHPRSAVVVGVAAGFLVGVCIGVVPIIMWYEAAITDCESYVDSPSCSHGPAGWGHGCHWISATNNSTIGEGPSRGVESDELDGIGEGSSRVAAIVRASAREGQLTADRGEVGRCAYPDGVNCSRYADKEQCAGVAVDVVSGQPPCHWSVSSTKCIHFHGWTASESGIFAGGLILGGFIGSPLASPLLGRFGRRGTLFALGLIGAAGTGVTALGWGLASFWTLSVGQVLLGVYSVVASVVAPMYCGEMAPQAWSDTLGMVFQVLLTCGISVGALVGLLMPPDLSDPKVALMLQAYYVVLWLPSLVMLVVGFSVREPTPNDIRRATAGEAEVDGAPLTAQLLEGEEAFGGGGRDDTLNNGHDVAKPRVAEPTHASAIAVVDPSPPPPLSSSCSRAVAIAFVCGVVMNVVQQLTGINSVMVYAPAITARVGFSNPLLGNFLVTLVNTLSGCCSFFVSRALKPRTMFLWGGVSIGVAATLVGVSVYPGLLDHLSAAGRVAVGCVAICAFIASYAVLIGPPYYVLAQGMFPRQWRTVGCSWTNGWAYLFNLVVNVVFPIAVQALSGGASGDQSLGTAIVYFIFAMAGVSGSAFLYFTLPRPQR